MDAIAIHAVFFATLDATNAAARRYATATLATTESAAFAVDATRAATRVATDAATRDATRAATRAAWGVMKCTQA